MLYIVIISAVVFVIGGNGFINFLAFSPVLILRGELWRLVTWVFLPFSGGGIFFVAIALYLYYFIGSTLEREWGTTKFTVYYILGILMNVLYGFIMWFAVGVYVNIVPYFLNLSMFFAFATLFPDFVLRLFFVIPVKVKWLALINCGFFAFSVVSGFLAGMFFSALLPLIALLNYFLVCGDDLLSSLQPLKMQASPQVINYKKAAKKARQELADQPYRHKCAVCGKTDVDHPDLEFRYCSRCSGYHCFCFEHINNHIHFE